MLFGLGGQEMHSLLLHNCTIILFMLCIPNNRIIALYMLDIYYNSVITNNSEHVRFM